jgi:hypothetical protein
MPDPATERGPTTPPERRVGHALTTPRAAPVAGIVFGVLMSAVIYLILIPVPSGDDLFEGEFLSTSDDRLGVGLALTPFAGIAFLWFLGVIRHHFGDLEDQFFSTVFILSGTLFVVFLFISAAVLSAAVNAHNRDPNFTSTSGYVALGQLAQLSFGTFALKTAGVCLLSLATMWLRTGNVPVWIPAVQYVIAVLLLFLPRSDLALFIFPVWIFTISSYILWKAFQGRQPEPI